MVKCSQCNAEISENVKFCPNCGTNVNKSSTSESENHVNSTNITKFCQNCGSKIDINAQICPNCGFRVAGFSEEKTPILALLLSVFFPGLGQFYNGQPTKGVILIIAAIVSIFLIIFFIGAILYLVVWVFSLYDAYTSAEAINAGRVLEDKLF